MPRLLRPRSLAPAALAAMLLAAVALPLQAATVTAFASGLPSSLYGITNDGSNLYFSGSDGLLRDFDADPDNGVIARIPLAGGAPTTLYSFSNYASSSGHVAPFQIVYDGAGGLFWADPDAGSSTGASFIKGTTSGAPPTQIFNICCGPGVFPGDSIGIAMDGGRLFFSDSTGGRIGADPSGSSATSIGPARLTPDFATASYSQIAVANGKVFIADSAQLRYGSTSHHQADQDQSAFLPPGVRWISTDGSSGFQDLSIGKIDHPRGIVAVGGLLYVSSARAVWSVRQSDGQTKLLVKDKRFKDLQGLTWANGALYVLDSQNKFGPPVGTVSETVKDGAGKIWKIVP